MKIKSCASPNEKSSPFYKKNEEFAYTFEKYIASKGGFVKGRYNAWSYYIIGKFTGSEKWILRYKKSSFTIIHSFLHRSKKQGLLVLSEWETERKSQQNSNFLIRKRKRLDFIRLLLNSSLSKLEVSNSYLVKQKKESSLLLTSLISCLSPLFITGEIYRVSLKKNLLKIELRTDKHHFEVLETILKNI